MTRRRFCNSNFPASRRLCARPPAVAVVRRRARKRLVVAPLARLLGDSRPGRGGAAVQSARARWRQRQRQVAPRAGTRPPLATPARTSASRLLHRRRFRPRSPGRGRRYAARRLARRHSQSAPAGRRRSRNASGRGRRFSKSCDSRSMRSPPRGASSSSPLSANRLRSVIWIQDSAIASRPGSPCDCNVRACAARRAILATRGQCPRHAC